MRCFIALPLPPLAREALARAAAPLQGRWPQLRWAAPESYHLTLAFLGELTEPALGCALRATGAAASTEAFNFSFAGLGYLPPRGSPRVLVADLAESPPESSSALYRTVNLALEAEAAVAGLGRLNPEWGPGGRPFRPHVTLARLGPGAPAPERGFLAGLAIRGEWTIDACSLYKSELRRGGSVYTELMKAALRAAP